MEKLTKQITEYLEYYNWGQLCEAGLCVLKQVPATAAAGENAGFTVEVQEMFVDDETSPDFPPAWREEMVTELYFMGELFL